MSLALTEKGKNGPKTMFLIFFLFYFYFMFKMKDITEVYLSKHKDGVGTGSSLGSVLANIIMAELKH